MLRASSVPHAATADSDSESDLVSLGEAAMQAQAEMGLATPYPPWLPVLPELLDLDSVRADGSSDDGVAIGLVDLPQLQRQEPLVLDLEGAGHIAVFGAGNSGKTTVLTSAALALSSSCSPQEMSLYCLDAGSGQLASLQGLAHCGGVVAADEEERVQRLMRLLLRRVERRGALTDDERQHEPATTVLLLDDFGSFALQYDRPGAGSVYEHMQQILAGGRAAGVHVILTASRRGALPAALATHFGQRLILRMTTEEDMLSLGLDLKTVRGAKLPVGSGFTQDSKEFHIAVPCNGDAPMPLTQAVESISHHTPSQVTQIQVLPTHVPRTSLTAGEGLNAIPVGISDEHLGTVRLDLSELHFLVVGPYKSGRSTALAAVAHGIRQIDPTLVLHLLSPRRSPLRDLDLWGTVATSAQDCAQTAGSLLERLEAQEFENVSSVVFIDDGGEFIDAVLLSRLERIARMARDSGLRVVASVESGIARGIGVPWVRELRRDGHGLLLQPDLVSDGDLLNARLPRHVAAPMTPGRGFVVVRGSAELIHVAS